MLKTAWMIDEVGAREARKEIAMIKALIPKMQTRIVDRAMQIFGAMGMSPDTPLAALYTWGRATRYTDGPDAVHLRTIARLEMKDSKDRLGEVAKYMTIPERL